MPKDFFFLSVLGNHYSIFMDSTVSTHIFNSKCLSRKKNGPSKQNETSYTERRVHWIFWWKNKNLTRSKNKTYRQFCQTKDVKIYKRYIRTPKLCPEPFNSRNDTSLVKNLTRPPPLSCPRSDEHRENPIHGSRAVSRVICTRQRRDGADTRSRHFILFFFHNL